MTRLTIAVVCLAGLAGSVHAEPNGAQAEALFNEGKQLMTAKKFAEACAKFESSQQLDPVVSTLLNEADCREKNQQLATAWGLFLEAERQTRNDHTNKKLHDVARNRAAKLEPRISKLTIKLDPANRVDGIEVQRDAEPVSAASLNSALPIDGGTYKISARAPGFEKWSAEVRVKIEHDTQTIEVPKLAREKAPEVAKHEPAKHEPAKHESTKQEPVKHEPAKHETADDHATGEDNTTVAVAPARRSRRGAFLFGGAAVALGLGAGGFELWGRSLLDSSKREPDPMKQDSLWHSANTRHYVAQGMGVAAIASAGVAVFLLVRGGGGGGRETDRSETALVPSASSDRVGFALVHAW